MNYVHVVSIEKYHPGYRDRKLQWAKMFFDMVHGDPEFEMIESEVDKWRFVTLVMLELQAQNPLPVDDRYFKMKGWDLKKRSISLTLQMLHNFLEVVTEDGKHCDLYKSKSKSKNKNKSKILCANLKTSFEEFWKIYDLKKGRPDCEEYWYGTKALKNRKRMDDEMRELAIASLPEYVLATNKNGDFPSRKNPKTYLYNSSWNDEIIVSEADSESEINADHIWEEYKLKGKDADPVIKKAFKIAGINKSYMRNVTTDTALRFARPKVEKIYKRLVREGAK